MEEICPLFSHPLPMSKKLTFSAVVPAAGSSRRMKGENKQSADLHGKPVIIRTLESLSTDSRIGEVIIAISNDFWNELQSFLKNFPISMQIIVVGGGAERQNSVYNSALKASGEYLVIHDGARPLLSNSLLKELLDKAEGQEGIIPVLPVSDTVKRVSSTGEVLDTLDRKQLFKVQTPQVIKKSVYLSAYDKAHKQGFCVTDDASLLEHAGYTVKAILGSETNIKITTPEDLEYARFIYGKTRV